MQFGDTALMMASRGGDIEKTLLLIRAGADKKAKNKVRAWFDCGGGLTVGVRGAEFSCGCQSRSFRDDWGRRRMVMCKINAYR